MALNPIQFQAGLSLPEFMRSFGTEAQCAEVVRRARWPDGWRCAHCGCTEHYMVSHERRCVFQCRSCRGQHSLTSGTVFASTKLPLTLWFLAIYLISQAKTGLSALALKRQLGVSYPTAWLLQHKIMGTMAQREQVHQLGGDVQIDDAYLGGERSGGKPGRGSENKVPFVAAVSLDAKHRPVYVKLSLVSGFTLDAIDQWAQANLAPGARVVSDGLNCFPAVKLAGCTHAPSIVGARKPDAVPELRWVNTILANLKTSLAGAYHSFGYRKYAAHYLGAFAYRFNRRFDLRGLVARLFIDVARHAPAPARLIRLNAADH